MRLGQTQGDRQGRWLLQRQAETDDAARADVDKQRQIGAADEHADPVDDVDEVDVGRRVVDLTDIKRPRRMDVARSRFQSMQVLSVGGAAFGDLLGREQQRDATFDRDIGWRTLAGLFAARPDFGDDRRQRRGFEHQPMRAQGHRNDGLDLARQPLPARPALLRQQRADTAIARVPLQQVVDLSRRQIAVPPPPGRSRGGAVQRRRAPYRVRAHTVGLAASRRRERPSGWPMRAGICATRFATAPPY